MSPWCCRRCADEHDLAAGLIVRGQGPQPVRVSAQSNFLGFSIRLNGSACAREGLGRPADAAAFTATNRLDLSRWAPDFVVQSFYKLFGYPTGVGCLLARKTALARLRRPWFSGGTITVASVQGDKYYLAEGATAFEDGTLDFLALPAVEIGLQHIESIGIAQIHERVRCLTGWLLENLLPLRQTNGAPLVFLYSPPTRIAAAGSSRSTSTAPTASRSTTASSSAARTPPTSRFARAASVILAAARSRSA
jgi:selenocysteine lyase/cysteine desulfurase